MVTQTLRGSLIKKILVVLGTRPEAIKLAPVIRKLKEDPSSFNVTVCTTGQHREMLDQVLSLFKISIDIDFNLMKPGQNLASLTSSILQEVYTAILKLKPELVIVHGDTTTALASSLAAFYGEVPIAHVEAGLRTFNMGSPFPEEFNRRVVSLVAKWNFAPTDIAQLNLIGDGAPENSIKVTGNTVVDSLKWMTQLLDSDQKLYTTISRDLKLQLNFDVETNRFILITGHRRENFGSGLLEICKSIIELSKKFKELNFVYPVHLNPNVLETVTSMLRDHSNIKLIPPQDYEHFVFLLRNCYFILTDSGGIQEEAPTFGKPVLVMRETTERPEAITAGTAKLVGARSETIVKEASLLIESINCYAAMSEISNPFGDGNSAQRIVDFLKCYE